MPNWCYNRMSISGDRENLVKLTETITRESDESLAETTMGVKQAAYDLTVLYPIPEDADWYSWCIENWGTKWSPRIEAWEIIDHADGTSTISSYFETVWSPASGLMAKVSEAFPTLLFVVNSDEEGMGFVSCEAFHNGELVSSEGSDLDSEKVPELFRKAWAELDEKTNAMSCDDDDYMDLYSERGDLVSDILGWCESRVTERLYMLGLLPKVDA